MGYYQHSRSARFVPPLGFHGKAEGNYEKSRKSGHEEHTILHIDWIKYMTRMRG